MKLKRKYLKQEEILTFDLKNAEMKVEDGKIVQEQIKIELLKANIKLLEAEITKRQYKISELRESKEKLRVSLKRYSDDIKKQCGVKEDNWGFDPLTGEIKL
jgi:predicted RNase H-like nuclease (RuvC/YqgF family)